jgi:hypothetical protein
MTDAIRKKVLRIMELAMLLNPADTTQEDTGDKPTVFVDFSGHCCLLEGRIYQNGWSTRLCPCGSGAEFKRQEPEHYRITLNRDLDGLDKFISDLEALYAEWKDKAPENV